MLQHCCNAHATRGERAPVEPVLLSQVRSERRFRALAAVAPGRAATVASLAAAGDATARPTIGRDVPSLSLVILGLCGQFYSAGPRAAPSRGRDARGGVESILKQ